MSVFTPIDFIFIVKVLIVLVVAMLFQVQSLRPYRVGIVASALALLMLLFGVASFAGDWGDLTFPPMAIKAG